MAKKCYYNVSECSDKLSREHLISAVVLKVAFGDPVRCLTNGEPLGDKYLIDHEQVLRDVCDTCNSALSTYDEAGAEFVRELDTFYDPTGRNLPFSQEILGWLIKTHLNHIRLIRDREHKQSYVVNQRIKEALIRHLPLPAELFRLLIEGWQGTDSFWDAASPKKIQYFYYRSLRFRNHDIALSNFRIKTLDTFFIIPSNNDYSNFDDRVKSALDELKRERGFSLQHVEPLSTIEQRVLAIDKVLPLSEVLKFIRQ